jgi:hypothetical protein
VEEKEKPEIKNDPSDPYEVPAGPPGTISTQEVEPERYDVQRGLSGYGKKPTSVDRGSELPSKRF